MILSTTGNSWNGIIQLIVAFIMFLFVLALAYFAAKLAGRFQGNVMARGNIRVIESSRVSTNTYVQIVKLGTRYFALGIGKSEIHVISELNPEDLDLTAMENPKKGNFKDILEQFQNKQKEDKSDET